MKPRGDRHGQNWIPTRDELIFAVEQLTEQVRLLGNIIDDLTSELQFQSRNAKAEQRPPFVLTSLPLDPAARNWRVNECSAPLVPQAAAAPADSPKRTLFD